MPYSNLGLFTPELCLCGLGLLVLIVDLTAREFALAEYFFRRPGQVLSREQILSNVWGYDFDPSTNIVDSALQGGLKLG